MEYNYIKSLHLIFVITWFAGLFYIVRLFVYQIEAQQKASPAKEILAENGDAILAEDGLYLVTE